MEEALGSLSPRPLLFHSAVLGLDHSSIGMIGLAAREHVILQGQVTSNLIGTAVTLAYKPELQSAGLNWLTDASVSHD